MKIIRSFLALKLNLDTVGKIAVAQKQLRDDLNDSDMNVAWVPPPNIHITIRFLGDVTEPMVYAIENMLRPLVARVPAFEVSAGSLGTFPDLKNPRVIWVGARSESNQLHTFHDLVSKKLADAGFPTEEKAFRSHITIGRVKGGNTEALAGPINQKQELSFGNTLVRNLICYRSDLKTKGSEYYPLWSLSLGQPLRIKAADSEERSNPPSDPVAESAPPAFEPLDAPEAEETPRVQEQPPSETEETGE